MPTITCVSVTVTGAAVGTAEGATVGIAVGIEEGRAVGRTVGARDRILLAGLSVVNRLKSVGAGATLTPLCVVGVLVPG